MSRAFAPIGFALLGAGVLHCSEPTEETGVAEGAHSEKEAVFANVPYFWAETDYATFKRIAQAPPFATGAPVSDDDIVRQRLQAWADRMHDEIARDVRAKTGKDLVAPRPIVMVVPAKEANAWVSGVPACVSGESDLSGIGQSGRFEKTAALVFLEHARVKEAFAAFGRPPPECTRPSNWPASDDVLSFFNASGSKCHLERTEADKTKVSGAECSIEMYGPTAAKRLTYYATSPYVHFTTAMVALAREERAIVGVLAHELGHYYRAHAFGEVVMGKYNHWYEQEDPPDQRMPPASADSHDLEARFRRVAPYPIPRVSGQRVSYRLSHALVDGIGSLMERARICAPATNLLQDGLRSAFGGFSGYVDRATREKYLAYEDALLACAGAIDVSDSDADGTLLLEEVQQVVEQDAYRFAEPALEPGTLLSVISTLNERAAVVDREEDDFRATLRSRRLGRYTSEQEADEFSLEYYARVGLEPKTRIDSYLELVETRYAEDPDRFAFKNDGLDVRECAALHRAGWVKDGQRVFVGLGDLHDPHHGDCYRLFNMSQDLRAHDHRASAPGPDLPGTWADIQAEAKRATEAFTPSRPPFSASRPLSPANDGAPATVVDTL
jgi:hypothetical protein